MRDKGARIYHGSKNPDQKIGGASLVRPQGRQT
jgi:hypothetical protein